MGIHQKNKKTLKIIEYHRKISFPAPARIHGTALERTRGTALARTRGPAQLRAYTASPSSAHTRPLPAPRARSERHLALVCAPVCAPVCSSLRSSLCSSLGAAPPRAYVRGRPASSISAEPPSHEHTREAAQSRACTSCRARCRGPRCEVRGSCPAPGDSPPQPQLAAAVASAYPPRR